MKTTLLLVFPVFALSLGFGVQASAQLQDPSKPLSSITFIAKKATAYDLILAVARQSRVPIGIVVGQDQKALFGTTRAYKVKEEAPREALMEATVGTGYSLEEVGGVFVFSAGDLTSRQYQLLTHSYENFGSNAPQTMALLSATLNMWLKFASDEETGQRAGYGGSILGSLDDEEFVIKPLPSANTEQIANRIVTLGSKGMWIFRVAPTTPADSTGDEITIKPYQEFAREATPRR